MKKRIKQGFTLVELVIVIAVIAILAAVLIPTFSNLITNAKNSADTQMVTNLNKYLASMEAIDGKNETMEEAMIDAKDAGYTSGSFLSASNTILWDEETDRFIAIKGNKQIAGEDSAKYDKNKNAQYWIVSLEISTEYATYLVGNKEFKDGLEVSLSLDLTEYKGGYLTVTVNNENLIINGVINTLNANKNNPTVYGYVHKLNGSVTSKNATFHGSNNNDNYVLSSENISGSYEIDHYSTNDKKCYFCNKEINPDHVHEYILSTDVTKTKAATCTAFGVNYYECKDTKCDSIKVEYIDKIQHTIVTIPGKDATCTEIGLTEGKQCSVCRSMIEEQATIDKLEHDYTKKNHDAAQHWNVCSMCSGAETVDDKEVKTPHNLSTISQNTSYEIKCVECGYKIDDKQLLKACEKAIELNNKLGETKHPTMHDAFLALTEEKTQENVKNVINEIGKVEIGFQILWDQTIDRFVVVQKISNSTDINIVYTPGEKNGIKGVISKENQYPLWDTYENIPEPTNQNYSIYFTEMSLENHLYTVNNEIYSNNSGKNFKVGFDMGFSVVDTFIDSGSSAYESSKNLTIVISGSYKSDIPLLYRTEGSKTALQIKADRSNILHYGSVNVILYGNGNRSTLYEYGSVSSVMFDPQGLSYTVTKIIAMKSSKFNQKNDELSELKQLEFENINSESSKFSQLEYH